MLDLLYCDLSKCEYVITAYNVSSH